jgi:hypothetical protein
MKIAVPTQDGLHIAGLDEHLKGYHVFSVSLGEITGEELRWNHSGRIKSGPARITDPVKDCSVILVKDNETHGQNGFGDKSVIPVTETLITKIIWNYLNNVLQEESNTCCCP